MINRDDIGLSIVLLIIVLVVVTRLVWIYDRERRRTTAQVTEDLWQLVAYERELPNLMHPTDAEHQKECLPCWVRSDVSGMKWIFQEFYDEVTRFKEIEIEQEREWKLAMRKIVNRCHIVVRRGIEIDCLDVLEAIYKRLRKN